MRVTPTVLPMADRRIHYIDVFTDTPLLGNPVAVILDGADLSHSSMQAVARWTNLSETTFVVPSDRGDYGLRIFTPVSELPFAGHPTVGSAHAVLEAGIADGPSLVQDCGAGLVPIERATDGQITAITPRTEPTGRDVEVGVVAHALRIDPTEAIEPTIIDAGPCWLVVRLRSSEAIDRLQPDLAAISRLSETHAPLAGITVYGHDDGDRVTVRSFAPAEGVAEDPVCGSGNAAVGWHRTLTEGPIAPYVARQGAALSRDGRVAVSYPDDRVAIGGHAVTTVTGVLHL